MTNTIAKQIEVLESPQEQGVYERLAWSFDFAGYLLPGQIPVAKESHLLDITTDDPYDDGLLGGITDDGVSVVTQAVHGLKADHDYRLTVVATVDGNDWQSVLTLNCPF